MSNGLDDIDDDDGQPGRVEKRELSVLFSRSFNSLHLIGKLFRRCRTGSSPREEIFVFFFLETQILLTHTQLVFHSICTRFVYLLPRKLSHK